MSVLFRADPGIARLICSELVRRKTDKTLPYRIRGSGKAGLAGHTGNFFVAG